MSDVDFSQFKVAFRERAQSHLTEFVMGPAEADMKQRARTPGDIFKFPSGETADGISIELVDPGNSRGWRFMIRANSIGARITNQGLLLTPNQNNARQLLTWRSKTNGQLYSKKSVDQRHLKDWVRKAFNQAINR